MEILILIAVALDLLIGDPRGWPHPVNLMAAAARRVECLLRRHLTNLWLAGMLTVGVIVGGTGLLTMLLLYALGTIHPLLLAMGTVYVLYSGLAARDLIDHSTAIDIALRQPDLEEARRRAGMICGRDTADLDEAAITRAGVESVAENLVDGVTAPLFYLLLAGPVGLMMYKAINTLDSLFGYRNPRYRQFGWAAARLDDGANFIPARLTGLMIPLAALLCGLDARNAWRIFRRDRHRHSSPNAGHTEAAVAGALNLQLGGPNVYQGQMVEKPFIGDGPAVPHPRHIQQANVLLLVTSGMLLLGGLGLRWLW